MILPDAAKNAIAVFVILAVPFLLWNTFFGKPRLGRPGIVERELDATTTVSEMRHDAIREGGCSAWLVFVAGAGVMTAILGYCWWAVVNDAAARLLP